LSCYGCSGPRTGQRMKPTASNRLPPSSEPDPKTLKELAKQIHLCFLQLENGGTPDWIQAEAARVFDLFYQKYLDLGGGPFPATENWFLDLITLEGQCRGEVTRKPQARRCRPVRGEWSKPMSKSRIKAALGIDSYYRLDKLAEQGVYELKQDPNNRQRWTIRLDTLDPQARGRFQGI